MAGDAGAPASLRSQPTIAAPIEKMHTAPHVFTVPVLFRERITTTSALKEPSYRHPSCPITPSIGRFPVYPQFPPPIPRKANLWASVFGFHSDFWFLVSGFVLPYPHAIPRQSPHRRLAPD